MGPVISEEEQVQKVTTKVFSDRYARAEWGWKPEFDTMEAIVEQFAKDFENTRSVAVTCR